MLSSNQRQALENLFEEQFTFVINPFDGHGTNFLGGISDHLELRRVFELIMIGQS